VIAPSRTLAAQPGPRDQQPRIAQARGEWATQPRRRKSDIRIVRFQVLESFLRADPGDFEVRLTSDLFVSGIPQNLPDFPREPKRAVMVIALQAAAAVPALAIVVLLKL
jgi:hypothetical protein